jgi:hypothetical protein
MLFAVCAGAMHASAQDDAGCPQPDLRPLEVTPASGATSVTIDAPIKVRYPAGYFVERCPPPFGACASIQVFRVVSGTPTPVPGAVQALGDVFIFTPSTSWAADSTFEGRATGIDGMLAFSFRTGPSRDVTPPSLGAITSISSARAAPSCDAPEGGYRIDVTLEPAIDDGPPGSIEYFAYLTRGPTVTEPQLRARIRNFPTSEITMAFVISREEGASPVCVEVQAADGIDGSMHRTATPIRCIDPAVGSFFDSLCAVSFHRDERASHASLFGVAFVAMILARRRAASAR